MIGLQMVGMRDMAEKDMREALRLVAQAGYGAVEFAGFFGNSAQDIAAWLAEFGLHAAGAHISMADLDERFEDTVACAKIIGCDYLVIPWADVRWKSGVDELIDKLNRYDALLKPHGIVLGYHNHAFELRPNKDGIVSMEEIISRTNVDIELDTYWAYAAEKDACAMLRRLHDRMHVYHLKDGMANGDGKPLGQGTAPVADVYATACELGLECIVESETITPDGITEARMCMEYLQKL